MIDDLLDEIEKITAESHSLVRQGVKSLIDERLEQRGQLLNQLFEHFTTSGEVPSDEQQARLEKLLLEDQQALEQLNQEQAEYQQNNRKKSKLNMYKQNLG